MINDYFDFPKEEITRVGIGGYSLDVRIKEEVLQINNVPNIPIEDGSFVNDHIIVQPDTITITGDVSGIHVKKSSIKAEVESLNNIVDTASVYIPPVTSFQARQIRNLLVSNTNISQGYINSINRGLTLFDLDTNEDDPQQDFFDKITKARKTKQLITVSMPFKTFKNMAVISFLTQADNEATSLGYEITLQEIIFAETSLVEKFKIDNASISAKTAAPTNKGTQTPTTDTLKSNNWYWQQGELG